MIEYILLAIVIAAGIPCFYFGTGIIARRFADRRAASFIGIGCVAITYDDGPSPKQTHRILDLLAESGASATFFLIGDSAIRHPDVVERIVAEGHAVGWHSKTHRNQWKCWPLTAWRDTTRIPGLLRSGRTKATIYRPPYGKINLASAIAARWRGLPISTWTLDSGDTHPSIPSVRNVVRRIDADGGGVVLMHDNERTVTDGEARDQFVIELTEALIDLARRRAWKLIPVPESPPRTA